MGSLSRVVAAVLFLWVVFLIWENAALGGELADTRAELSATRAELNDTRGELAGREAQLSATQAELNETRGELGETRAELADTEGELAQREAELNYTQAALSETAETLNETIQEFIAMRGEISGLEESITSSIQWFRENSVLPRSMDRLFWKIDGECKDGNTLRLGCAIFIMEDEVGFSYRNEYPDRLYSLEEMVAKNGGDCEDYALMLKAILNRYKDAGLGPELEAWEQGTGKYVIYQDDGTVWYMDGKAYPLGSLRGLYPYAVCYTTYVSGMDFEGHCRVALADGEISSASEIGKLGGAQVFEPQTGEYTGKVGEDYGLCAEGETFCDREVGSIVFVIGDGDLYQFKEGGWVGYELYGEYLSQLDWRIAQITGG